MRAALVALAVASWYILGGPVIGGLIVALGLSFINGMPFEMAPTVVLYGVLGGFYYGLIPAIAAYIAHIGFHKWVRQPRISKLLVATIGGLATGAWTTWVIWVSGYEAPLSLYGAVASISIVGAVVAFALCHLTARSREQQA